MELFWHFRRQKCLVIAEKNWGQRILSEIFICSELYQTSRATVTIREACIIVYTMQFWTCLCIDFIFIWEHNYKLWSNCVIYPVTSICYPVWMPWRKYQCMKCHWFMCLWLGWAFFCIGVSGNGILSLAFCPEINKHCSSIILSHYFIRDLFLVLFDISHICQLV